jgi:hypothetical protein
MNRPLPFVPDLSGLVPAEVMVALMLAILNRKVIP